VKRSSKSLTVYTKIAPIKAPPINAPTRGIALFMAPAPVLEGSAVDVVSMADVIMADVIMADVLDLLVVLDLLGVLDVLDVLEVLDVVDVLDGSEVLDVLESGDVLDSPDVLVVVGVVMADVEVMPETLAGPMLTVGLSVLDVVAVWILTSFWSFKPGA
jgi:hypothetical protein